MLVEVSESEVQQKQPNVVVKWKSPFPPTQVAVALVNSKQFSGVVASYNVS